MELFLLFASNVVAMVVASVVMFTIYGFGAEAWDASSFRRRRAYWTLAAALLLVLVPLALTTRHTLQLQSQVDSAKAIARAWANDEGQSVVAVEFRGSQLIVLVEGPSPPSGTDALLSQLRSVLPADTPVVLNHVFGELDAARVERSKKVHRPTTTTNTNVWPDSRFYVDALLAQRTHCFEVLHVS